MMDIPRSPEFPSFFDVEEDWLPDTSMVYYEINPQNPVPFRSEQFRPMWNSEIIFYTEGKRVQGKFLEPLFEDHPNPSLKIFLGWRVEIDGEPVNIPRSKLGTWGYVPKEA